MKKIISLAIITISMVIVFSSCSDSAPKNSVSESNTNEKATYTCTMHPEIKRDKPGKCPKCGMELVKMNSHVTVPVGDQSDTTKTYR
jgi:Cu(I)/Ag(I) efflux system membrane fusion protein